MNLSPPQNRLYFCLVSLSFICNISLIPISLPYYQLKGISDLCISHYNIFFNMYKTLGTSHIVSVKESFIFSIFWYTKYTYFWLFKEFKVFFFFQLNLHLTERLAALLLPLASLSPCPPHSNQWAGRKTEQESKAVRGRCDNFKGSS